MTNRNHDGGSLGPAPFTVNLTDSDPANGRSQPSPEQPLPPRGGVSDIAEILIAARKLIARRKDWCQGALKQPRMFGLRCSYCMMGAIEAVAPSRGREARLLLSFHTGDDCGLATFNDTHTHAEVLAAFDAAISAAVGVGKSPGKI